MDDQGLRHLSESPDGRPVAIELFSGAGGMSLGFEAAGFETLVAIDNNPIHVATHEWNFQLTRSVCADIETLSAEDILTSAKDHWSKRYPDESWPGDIDCIFGGPSCQGFSEIGRRNPQDERNNLLSAFARLVAAIRPKYFVMENVPGLLAPVNDSIRAEALSIFVDANYSLSAGRPFILSAGDFGVPQARRRVFVVGSRKDMAPVDVPVATRDRVTVAEALDDLRCLELYRSLARKDSIQLSAAALAKMEAAASAYVRSLRNGSDLAYGSYGLGYSRSWDRSIVTSAGRTAHRNEVRERFRSTQQGAEELVSRLQRLRADGLAPTLRAGTARDHGSFTSARPIHHRYPRVITVREAARLHSFPDWFRFHVTKWHGFQQIGNSVPPFLAETIAGEVIRALGSSPLKNKAKPEPRDDSLLTLGLVEAAMHYDIDPATLPKESRVRKPKAAL
ncbi:MAG: DNA cytosine methyltransferase [Actinobacteria bacterium]|nr:DNA cytosine methyltransferase [Actinomycetota bacterium]